VNIRELRYMAELVRRDGDKYLQMYHGILDRHALYQAVIDMANRAEMETCGATHFAIYRDATIGDFGGEK